MTITAAIITVSCAVLLLAAGYFFRSRRRRQRRQAQKVKPHRQTGKELPATLARRERPSLDSAELVTNVNQRRDLSPLLDRIAANGRFSTMLLSDDDGLPLACTSGSENLDRLAANSIRLVMTADRLSGEENPDTLSMMVRDTSGTTTLYRTFHVRGKKLFLTAVSNDLRLTSAALDPAIIKIEAVLTTIAG